MTTQENIKHILAKTLAREFSALMNAANDDQMHGFADLMELMASALYRMQPKSERSEGHEPKASEPRAAHIVLEESGSVPARAWAPNPERSKFPEFKFVKGEKE